MPEFPTPVALRPTQKAAPQFATEPDIALVVGRASWWLPAAANQRKHKYSFAEALNDFLRNVSFHSYGKLVEPRRFKERFFWLVFHIAALTILIIFLWNTRNIDGGQLLATTIYNPLYPVERVAFPAVSICTRNRISNASALRYAEELNAKDPQRRGVSYFYEEIHLMYLNYFIQDPIIDYERTFAFQSFLDTYDTADSEMFFNTRRRMQMLTPNCSDMLISCRLGGQDVNCTHEFQTTLTGRGFCCTFNHDSRYSVARKRDMRLYGAENGLTLTLNASADDAFLQQNEGTGFVVIIYAASNYADFASGGILERYIQAGYESFMAISPKILETLNEARIFSPTTRNCLFDDEMPRAFGKSYNFNKCITRCRVRSILVLCQCLLFQSPYEYLDAATDTVYCTLQHRACLYRYDFKWLNVITQRTKNVRGLAREMEDALYCPDCLPSCSETRYSMSVATLPLNSYRLSTFAKDIDGKSTDLSLLHIYFAAPHAQYFQQILKDSWYEVFSRIGNICGIITGFSLIGICEVLFFLAKQLCLAYRNEVLLERNFKIAPKPEPLIILP